MRIASRKSWKNYSSWRKSWRILSIWINKIILHSSWITLNAENCKLRQGNLSLLIVDKVHVKSHKEDKKKHQRKLDRIKEKMLNNSLLLYKKHNLRSIEMYKVQNNKMKMIIDIHILGKRVNKQSDTMKKKIII